MARNDWISSVRDARRRAEALRNDDRPGPGRFLALGLLGALVGAATAFLFDPDRGRSRRAKLADQTAALLRDVSSNVQRGSRYVGSTLQGKAEALRHAGTGAQTPNDATLATRIESELFRDPDVPKGDININVEQGIVVLRGQVADPAMSERLEKAARSIPGVWEVENLLHLPGEPAPTHR
jgi:hypothetical protein